MAETFPQIIHTNLGDTVSYKGKFLYSSHVPTKNPEKIARSTNILAETLCIIPSPLLLHGISTLLKRLPANCHILCVEIDQSLMALTLEYAPSNLLDNNALSVVRTDDPVSLTSYIDTLDITRFRRVLVLPLSGGYQLYRTAYNALAVAAERHIQRYWQNRITLIHMGRLWIKNIINNLARHWKFFDYTLPVTEKPIVVAGAGESLEKALGSLKKERDRFFLLAVDTALQVLTSLEVIPDLVIMLEGQLVNSGDFIGHGNRHIPLLSDLSAHPSTISGVPGSKHFVLSQFAQTAFLHRLEKCFLSIPSIRPMGSVGVVAVEIARRLSAAPLFLTGLDFCYTPGKPHSRGALSHVLSLATCSRNRPVGWYGNSMRFPLIQVEGNRDRDVTTDLILYSYGSDLNDILRQDSLVYDLKREGIRLAAIALHTDSEFEKVLNRWEKRVKKTPTAKVSGNRSLHTKQSVRRFLENEAVLLESFLDHYRRSKAAGLLTSTNNHLFEALREVDYVHVDFPDVKGPSQMTGGFFFRAAASAADYLRCIQKALKILE